MSYTQPEPRPTHEEREDLASERRHAAEKVADWRPRRKPKHNGESSDYAPRWPTNFHKGLPHDEYGMVEPIAFRGFVEALTGRSPREPEPGWLGRFVSNVVGVTPAHAAGPGPDPDHPTSAYAIEPLHFNVPIGPADAEGAYRPADYSDAVEADPFGDDPITPVDVFSCEIDMGKGFEKPVVRNWESPRAGHTYTIEGPDTSDLGIAPAPRLGKSELCAEMAEVYLMALLRDETFEKLAKPSAKVTLGDGGGAHVSVTMNQLTNALTDGLSWFDGSEPTFTSFANTTGDDNALTEQEERRRRARWFDPEKGRPTDLDGKPFEKEPDVERLTPRNLFRGSVPGAKYGPYISQFLLQGNDPPRKMGAMMGLAKSYMPSPVEGGSAGEGSAEKGSAGNGRIGYGLQTIDQKIRAHKKGTDYMTHWSCWLDVQNGADMRGLEQSEGERFITTPRDLASYVHRDQLYQAYLNAGLLMLAVPGQNQPMEGGKPLPHLPTGRFDIGFPTGDGHATRGSFATFGPAQVLSLVTEVASRAIRAVRRQKFQIHLRARPEQIGGVLTLVANGKGDKLGHAQDDAENMLGELNGVGATGVKLGGTNLLALVDAHNEAQNAAYNKGGARVRDTIKLPSDSGFAKVVADNNNHLLAMAFPEGSPMHAAYGAGHATVAGACVTVLKALFEMFRDPRDPDARDPLQPGFVPLPEPETLARSQDHWTPLTLRDFGLLATYVGDGEKLRKIADTAHGPDALTVQGELNKLAANISIGRNMAGVHYYSDYYDSLRLGERVAVAILQEQMMTYPEPLTMRFNGFDSERVVVANEGGPGAAKGGGNARVIVMERNEGGSGWSDVSEEWWTRNMR